jgi:hypothetical protein
MTFGTSFALFFRLSPFFCLLFNSNIFLQIAHTTIISNPKHSTAQHHDGLPALVVCRMCRHNV